MDHKCEWQDGPGVGYCTREATHSFSQYYVDLWVMAAFMCAEHVERYRDYIKGTGDHLVVRELKKD